MFRDRDHAGALLADAIARAAPSDPVVLALPRGGVPVALPVARRLNAPLDLLMVRKLGLPGQPEVAAGAVVDGPAHEVVFNTVILRAQGLSEDDFDAAVTAELDRIARRRALWLAGHPPLDVRGRTAIVVDDGIATGATARAALKGLRRRAPAAIWLAVPVAAADAKALLAPLVDKLICLETPRPFLAVGGAYGMFDQVDDDAVTRLLQAAWAERDNETEPTGDDE